MRKPRLSLNLNKIIQKEKKIIQKSFTKFALLCLTFHFSDIIFSYISGKLLSENTTIQSIPYSLTNIIKVKEKV